MNIEEKSQSFNNNLSIKLNGLLPPQLCAELIDRYEKTSGSEQSDSVVNDIIDECANLVFVNEVDALLKGYFQSEYQVNWPRIDAVGSSDTSYYLNTLWHLDGGVKRLLKLFVYLNPVSEHGGNTLIIDQDRTEKLSKEVDLRVHRESNFVDVSQILEQLDLDAKPLDYDLKAGDAVLFSPLVLAHRCLPPKEGKKRYTVCFTVTPPL